MPPWRRGDSQPRSLPWELPGFVQTALRVQKPEDETQTPSGKSPLPEPFEPKRPRGKLSGACAGGEGEEGGEETLPWTSLLPGRKDHRGSQAPNRQATLHPAQVVVSGGADVTQPSTLKACPSAGRGEGMWPCTGSERPFKALKTSCSGRQPSDTPVPRAMSLFCSWDNCYL